MLTTLYIMSNYRQKAILTIGIVSSVADRK